MLQILFCIIIIINYSNQDTCSLRPNLNLIYVDENNEKGSPIFNYTVFQPGTDILSAEIVPPEDNYFGFNKSTLQLIALIAFKSTNETTYSFRLFMKCNSSSIHTYEQVVTIIRSNTNQMSWKLSIYTGYIADDSSNNTAVFFNSTIEYAYGVSQGEYLINLVDDTFYATSSQPLVTILNKKLLNYDNRNVYNLTLSLQNKDQTTGSIKASTNSTIIINVIKSYNKLPVFEMPFYTFQIYTNATNNSLFQVSPKAIKAVDVNVPVNTTILYKFTDPLDYLSLDSSTAEIRSNTLLLTSIVLRTKIIAYVINNKNLWSSVDIMINISSVPLTFYQKFQSEIVQESTFRTIQLNFTADQNKKLYFTMNPNVSNFLIHSTGQILIQSLSYDSQNIYNFTITGSDGTTSDQMIIIIYVSKVYNPMFSMSSYSFFGDSSSGNIDGIISVVNFNSKSTITFFLLNDYGLFKIRPDSSNCIIYISQEDLYKINQLIYQLVINFSDSSQPSISKSVNVTVKFSYIFTTTTKPSIVGPKELLIICILVPVIVLLILIFPILLCYYKKRLRVMENKVDEMNQDFNPNLIATNNTIYPSPDALQSMSTENIQSVSNGTSVGQPVQIISQNQAEIMNSNFTETSQSHKYSMKVIFKFMTYIAVTALSGSYDQKSNLESVNLLLI